MIVYLSRTHPARTLLAHAMRVEHGMDTLPKIETQAGGKPCFSTCSEVEFNLSHSGDLALCALDSTPVGVDVQIIKDSWRAALPRRICSAEEFTWLEEQEDLWTAFTTLWTLKEARAKYSGEGLRMGVRAISVPLPRPGERLYRHDGLWFRLYDGEGWKAAVCGEHIPPEELILV